MNKLPQLYNRSATAANVMNRQVHVKKKYLQLQQTKIKVELEPEL